MPRAKNADQANRGNYAPRKPKQVDLHPTWYAEYSGFANYDPTEKDKQRFDVWLEVTDVWEKLQEYTELGYKFTFSVEPRTGTSMATTMCRDEQSVNAGLMVSARSTDVGRALTKLLFIVDQCLGVEWSVSAPAAGRDW